MLRAAPALLAPVVLAVAASAASPLLTGQDRSVHATSQTVGYLWDEASNAVFPDFDPPTNTVTSDAVDDASASDFETFSTTASTQDPSLIIVPQGTASGSQTSSLSAANMTASGSYTAVSDVYFMTQAEIDFANFGLQPPIPYNFGIAGDDEIGRSSFSVDFDVSEPTSYHLTGSLALSTPQFFIFSPATTGVASIALEESGGGSVVALSIDQATCSFEPCSPLSDSVDIVGVLVPGSYTLSAEVVGSSQSYCADIDGFVCSEPTSDGSFDVVLALGAGAQVPALGPAGLALLAIGLWVSARRVIRSLPRG